jgi:uncharacterized protein
MRISIDPAAGADSLLDDAVARLVAEFDPKQVILFGSRARGEGSDGSDYDLLVVATSEQPPHQRMSRALATLRGIQAAFDALVYTPEEFAEYRTWLSDIARLAADEGIVIFDAPA